MEKIIFFDSMIQPKGGLFSTPVIIMLIISVLIIALMLFLTFGLASSIKNSSLTVTDKELIIKSALYGKKIPLENVMLNEAMVLDLNENREYAVSHRTSGMHLPGIMLGWMRLKNKEKALAFVTDNSRVVLIPTKEFLILFSMNNADEFIRMSKTTRSR